MEFSYLEVGMHNMPVLFSLTFSVAVAIAFFLGSIFGELRAYKRHRIHFRRSRVGSGFWPFKRYVDTFQLVEMRDGQIVRTFSDTDDLSSVPSLTEEQLHMTKALLSAGLTAISSLTGAGSFGKLIEKLLLWSKTCFMKNGIG